MKSKFIFFDSKRSFFINILIVLQMALWIFYMASLISLIRFNSSSNEKINKSFKKNTSAELFLNELIPESNTEDTLYSKINEILSVLESKGYKGGFISSSDDYPTDISIPLDVIHAKKSDLYSKFNQLENSVTSLKPFYMNQYVLDSYKDNIIGKIDLSTWNQQNDIPVILGSTFSKSNHIGDKFKIQNKFYKIVGFFKKDTLSWSQQGASNSLFSLNNSFVIPINKKVLLKKYACQPIIIYSKSKININDIKTAITPLYDKAKVQSVTDNINNYLKQLKRQTDFKALRLLVTSILITCSLLLTLSYEIYTNRDRIGILFSFGINKNKIFFIISYEFSMILLCGLMIGCLFYLRNCEIVDFIYVNDTLLSSLYIAIVALIIISIFILRISFNNINKLTPKEMIGGFVE